MVEHLAFVRIPGVTECPICHLDWLRSPPQKGFGLPVVYRCSQCYRCFDESYVTGLEPLSNSTVEAMPWQHGLLSCWSIVGMNHYAIAGSGRQLFVAMTRFGKCIQAEGPDDARIWAELERKAREAASGG